MSKKILLKTLICSACLCNIGMLALAADVRAHTENRGISETSWMDRTDIGVGIQMSQTETYHDYKEALNPGHLGTPVVNHSNHTSKHDTRAHYFVETLQPIKHYDGHSKSVLFWQGKLDGNGGEKITRTAYWNGSEGSYDGTDPHWLAVDQTVRQPYYLDKGESIAHESLGLVGSLGIGYRHLSQHEHAYVGANAFYDHAFKDNVGRLGLGLEYVSGFNTLSANLYYGLSEKKTAPHKFATGLDHTPRSEEFHDTAPDVGYPDTPNGVIGYRSAYEHALGGFDLRYTRDYKNARWLSTYVEGYHWKAKSLSEHPLKMFYID